jgi:hypothetical protein
MIEPQFIVIQGGETALWSPHHSHSHYEVTMSIGPKPEGRAALVTSPAGGGHITRRIVLSVQECTPTR